MSTGSWYRERFGWTMLVILPILYLVAGCAQEPTSESNAVRPVKTVVVSAGDNLRTRSFPGKVEASQTAELTFLVPGLLVKLPVREGNRIAKGGIIAQLRQDEFEAQLNILQSRLAQANTELNALKAGERTEQRARLEAQVRAAEATLRNAEADYNRHAGLLQSKAISRSVYERVETTYRVAQEELRSARELLDKAMTARKEDIDAKEAEIRGLEARLVEGKIQLRDSTLLAPFNGVVARRFVEQQQTIRAQEPIVVFQDTDEIFISVDMPETVMINEIQSANVKQAFATFDGAAGSEFPVHITETARSADPITQTFRVRFAMKVPPDINLLPGMTARVTLVYSLGAKGKNRLLAPVSAVFKDPSGEQVVWVIGEDQSVVRRPVTLGSPLGAQIEIIDGLQPGDRIAVAGVSFLRPGMKVRDLGDALGGM